MEMTVSAGMGRQAEPFERMESNGGCQLRLAGDCQPTECQESSAYFMLRAQTLSAKT
jgi:hypothetical protein